MILEELIEYEQLSTEDKYLYKHFWNRYPHYNHNQLMTRVALEHV